MTRQALQEAYDAYTALVERAGPDGALIADGMRSLARETDDPRRRFAYAYAGAYFVPYVHWAVRDAEARGVDRLYFVARDGYHLQRIADALIAREGFSVRTAYLYGSRALWRVPSYVDEVDEFFFDRIGNLKDVEDFASLLSALALTEAEFLCLFPQLGGLAGRGWLSRRQVARAREAARESAAYRERLLEVAGERRGIVLDYLRQEIDFSQRYAFVEYWGRGYTQDCLHRLLRAADLRAEETVFYYARSVEGDGQGCVRRQFTRQETRLIFAEALFANMPYGTVERYRYGADGRVEAALEGRGYDEALFSAMEALLPRVSVEWSAAGVTPEGERAVFDAALAHVEASPGDPMFLEVLAPLLDSVAIHGRMGEYAPRVTAGGALRAALRGWFPTKDMGMSIARSGGLVRGLYAVYGRLRGRKA